VTSLGSRGPHRDARALEVAARVNADARAQREIVASVMGDPRVARRLNERVLPKITGEDA
jgi:hypothetical protein